MDRNGFVLVTFHGGSFLVDFLKNVILGFDENLATMCYFAITPEAFVCERHQELTCMVAYGKINTRPILRKYSGGHLGL